MRPDQPAVFRIGQNGCRARADRRRYIFKGVKSVAVAAAPIEMKRGHILSLRKRFQHRHDRRDAGAAGKQNRRARGVAGKSKFAERPFEADDVAGTQLVVDVGCEASIGDAPDVQFERAVGTGRVGDGEGVEAAVLADHTDILAGTVLDRRRRRRLERYNGDVGRGLCDCNHTGRTPELRGDRPRRQFRYIEREIA